MLLLGENGGKRQWSGRLPSSGGPHQILCTGHHHNHKICKNPPDQHCHGNHDQAGLPCARPSIWRPPCCCQLLCCSIVVQVDFVVILYKDNLVIFVKLVKICFSLDVISRELAENLLNLDSGPFTETNLVPFNFQLIQRPIFILILFCQA